MRTDFKSENGPQVPSPSLPAPLQEEHGSEKPYLELLPHPSTWLRCGFGGPTEASLLAVPAVCWPEATRGRRRKATSRGGSDMALQRLLLWTGKLQERGGGVTDELCPPKERQG